MKNVFIEYQIILNSNKEKLKNELELLVSKKYDIFIWSKTISLQDMRRYCLGIIYNNIEDKELHQKVKNLRQANKTYKEIAEITNISVTKIGFYLSTPISKVWTLDDWIKGYFLKDSSIYQKADYIIDNDRSFVDRFKKRGIEGNYIERL